MEGTDGWADDHPQKMMCLIHHDYRPMTAEELEKKRMREVAGRPRTKAESLRRQKQALLEMF